MRLPVFLAPLGLRILIGWGLAASLPHAELRAVLRPQGPPVPESHGRGADAGVNPSALGAKLNLLVGIFFAACSIGRICWLLAIPDLGTLDVAVMAKCAQSFHLDSRYLTAGTIFRGKVGSQEVRQLDC